MREEKELGIAMPTKKKIEYKPIKRMVFDKLKIYEKNDDTYAIRFSMESCFSKGFLSELEGGEVISFLVSLLRKAVNKFTEETLSKIKEIEELN